MATRMLSQRVHECCDGGFVSGRESAGVEDWVKVEVGGRADGKREEDAEKQACEGAEGH